MFSGIVKVIGSIKEIAKYEDGKNIVVSSQLETNDIKIGDSVAVSGCCLTVISRNGNDLGFYISADTLKKTTLAMLSIGSRVNLESSLRYGDYIGGCVMTGHIDETARIVEIDASKTDKKIKVAVSNFGKNLLIQRGTIVIDGVSLTVSYLSGSIVTLNIIPHTWENTILKFANTTTNFLVNVEYDSIAKHVYKIVKHLIVR